MLLYIVCACSHVDIDMCVRMNGYATLFVGRR